MNRVISILALTALTALAASPVAATGVPSTINLQGRFTNGAGNILADGIYTVVFSIYDDSIAGTLYWSDTLPVQVTDGLFTILVGKDTPIPANIFPRYSELYLGVMVNPEPELPRVPLSSVAYAFQGQYSEVATLSQDLVCLGCVSASEVDPTEVQLRVIGTAPAGEYITGINENGTVVTATDANDTYTAGTGLELDANQFAIPPNGVTSTEIASGAVVGGLAGDIADGTITADDLSASSVGSSEIDVGAVGSSEIATDGVMAPDIATGAVGTSEVLDGSLTAVDIDDEPGVASHTQATGINLNGTIQTLLSRSIVAPAAGYILAIGTAQVTMFHTTGGFSAANLGVSSTAGVFPANQALAIVTAPGLPTDNYYEIATAHGLFSTAGGSDVFYLLADETNGNVQVRGMQLTLIYFPTAYGTVVSTTTASAGETSSYEGVVTSPKGAETSSVLPETVAAPVQEQAANPTDFQQKLALMKAEMEARIQELEESLRLSQPGSKDRR